MGSLIMHITTSKIVAEKYNLSNKFLAGSIMPDALAKCEEDRYVTHFINPLESNLPNYTKYIEIHNGIIKDELELGYLAHLIEDYIWFSIFVPKYAIIIPSNLDAVKYIKDGSVHTDEEFSNEIYGDYSFIDNYIMEKYNIDIKEIKSNITQYFSGIETNQKIDKYLCKHKIDVNRKNFFITEQDADNFIKIASNEVEKILKKYIGD